MLEGLFDTAGHWHRKDIITKGKRKRRRVAEAFDEDDGRGDNHDDGILDVSVILSCCSHL
jgi:hypothetical protein